MHKQPPEHTRKRIIALLGFEGAAALDITGPYEVFAMASRLAQENGTPPYRLVLLAERAGHRGITPQEYRERFRSTGSTG